MALFRLSMVLVAAPFLGAAIWPSSTALADSAGALPIREQALVRRPIAVAWIERGTLLAVANQRSGTISIVDFRERQVVDEIAVGDKLAHMAALPGSRRLLVVDEKRHELIVLEPAQRSLRIASRLTVSPYPVHVAASADGSRLAVASLWSRKVTLLAKPERSLETEPPVALGTIDLSFNPGWQTFFVANDKGYLAVADAFGDRLAIVDVERRTLADAGVASLTGPQASMARERIFAPQMLRGEFPIRREAVASGRLLQGNHAAHTIGADSKPLRLPVAGTPELALDWSEDAVIDAAGGAIPLGPDVEKSPADRGEELFYDPRLSAGGQISCHSCHTRGHTNGQLADTLGDGTHGTPKRIPTLLGTRLTDKWAWNGEVRELHEQVAKSLENTMHATGFTPRQVTDLTAFLHSLPPPPPLRPATDDPADQQQLARGQALFKSLGCTECHVPPLTYTSQDAYDVGLSDEKGLRKFNPPSLRGVGQSYRFLHDGRAHRLSDVFIEHGHQLDRSLAEGELADLLRFLESL